MSTDPLAETNYSLLNRLIAEVTDECVLWPKTQDGDGYGQLWANGRMVKAHRLACELSHGVPTIQGAQAAHACRNRHCINPRHLRWATASENQQDRKRDGTVTSLSGESNPSAKLTESDVRTIRRYPLARTRVVANWYGVSTDAVWCVVTRKKWGWLQ